MGLFKKAESVASRVKMYIYGETGTGKSYTALHFPAPAIVDTEKGTKHYGKYFDFHRLETDNVDDVHSAINELLQDPEEFKTFIIDSMSDIYDSIKNKREAYLKKRSGDITYELKPTDYGPIKKDVRLLMRKLLALDLNVIVTARSKELFSQESFMQKAGTQAEGHKDTPYRFDIIIELVKNEKGVRIARVDKDRTNTLPPEFEFNYDTLVKYLDVEGLERNADAETQKEALSKAQDRGIKIKMGDKELYTAGVTADTLQALKGRIETYKLSTEQSQSYLRDVAGVDSFLDLNEQEAAHVLSQLDLDYGNNN